jgi:hypothetical protein
MHIILKYKNMPEQQSSHDEFGLTPEQAAQLSENSCSPIDIIRMLREDPDHHEPLRVRGIQVDRALNTESALGEPGTGIRYSLVSFTEEGLTFKNPEEIFNLSPDEARDSILMIDYTQGEVPDRETFIRASRVASVIGGWRGMVASDNKETGAEDPKINTITAIPLSRAAIQRLVVAAKSVQHLDTNKVGMNVILDGNLSEMQSNPLWFLLFDSINRYLPGVAMVDTLPKAVEKIDEYRNKNN